MDPMVLLEPHVVELLRASARLEPDAHRAVTAWVEALPGVLRSGGAPAAATGQAAPSERPLPGMPPASRPPRAVRPQRPARVVVADDSALQRAVLREHLEASGYEVLEAESGGQALALAWSRDPDVLLLDREMPEIDGHRVLAQLRRDPRTEHLPVVFVTGRASAEDLADGLDRGAHDYVRKPVERAELLARVRTALRVRALHEALAERNLRLEELAGTDGLTGLANRRRAEAALRALVDDPSRDAGAPAPSVVLADIDHFKRCNDVHGHAAGDAVLREVARRLLEGAGAGDLVARWGGEELLVVLAPASPDVQAARAEAVRAAIAAEPVVHDGVAITVTASLGWATPRAGEDVESLLARADAAMYAAKAAGRDRVCAAAAPGPPLAAAA